MIHLFRFQKSLLKPLRLSAPNSRRGYLLLALGVIFTLMGLSAGVSWLERRTVFQREFEVALRQDLGHLRLGIDLYKYRSEVTNPFPASISSLISAYTDNDAGQVIDLLSAEGHVSHRLASGSWRVVQNLLKNPSFELDDTTDFGGVATPTGTWHGNRTSNDRVPNGWNLIEDGVEQYLELTGSFPATYVASFWGRTPVSGTTIRYVIEQTDGTNLVEISASSAEWRRYYGTFAVTATQTVRQVVVLSSTGGTDHGLVDGLMIERWWNPSNTWSVIPPLPSAWVSDFGISSSLASRAVHLQWFTHLFDASGRQASEAWLFQL